MRIIFTGGGTAGHVNPAIAIAKYYKKRHKDAEILFVGTPNGIEKKLAQKEGIAFKGVEVRGLKRDLKAVSYNLKTVSLAINSLSQAKKIIDDFKPDLVFGCGGYASFPLIKKASSMGIHTMILEVNAYAGLTTKILASSANEIFIAFDETLDYLKKSQHKKVIKSGCPVKEDLLFGEPESAKEKLGFADKPFVVSFWGSMGALYMNQKMVDFVNTKDDSFYHLHATGDSAFSWFSEKTKGCKSQIVPYIYNMPDVLSAADLVISRAGAMTLNELSMMGKAAIVVPSPFVAENHQEKNARALEKVGGVKVMLEKEISGQDILQECKNLLAEPSKLEQMGKNIKKTANLNSNEIIYKRILDVK